MQTAFLRPKRTLVQTTSNTESLQSGSTEPFPTGTAVAVARRGWCARRLEAVAARMRPGGLGARLCALVLSLALTAAPAAANCLARSQNAIAAVQLLNAYSISRYGWQGDRWYDQVLPACGSHPGFVEFGCNVAFNVGLRLAEDAALKNAPEGDRKAVCALNYLGAAAFAFYVRKAVGVQVLGVRF